MATVDDEKYMAPTVEANFRTFAMSVLKKNHIVRLYSKENDRNEKAFDLFFSRC